MLWIGAASVLVAAAALVFALYRHQINAIRDESVAHERLDAIAKQLDWIVPWFREDKNGHDTLPAQVRKVTADFVNHTREEEKRFDEIQRTLDALK